MPNVEQPSVNYKQISVSRCAQFFNKIETKMIFSHNSQQKLNLRNLVVLKVGSEKIQVNILKSA